MTEKQRKFKDYYEDKKNWRPPSFSQVMVHMGWKSKNSVTKAIQKYEKNKQEEKVSHSLR